MMCVVVANGGAAVITAQRWRILIIANAGHSNTSITDLFYFDTSAGAISYSGGTASASTSFATPTYQASNAFDASDATRWATTNISPNGQWIEFSFAAPVTVGSVTIKGTTFPDDNVKTFDFQYYNGSTWVTIRSVVNEAAWASLQMRNYVLQ